jgi:excisionase family DNA binding protein
VKKTWWSVKELAHELGISADSVYRAYRKREIPAFQICRTIRFDLEKVRYAMKNKAEAMRNRRCHRRATGGDSRRRARTISPRSVKRGRNSKRWSEAGATKKKADNAD